MTVWFSSLHARLRRAVSGRTVLRCARTDGACAPKQRATRAGLRAVQRIQKLQASHCGRVDLNVTFGELFEDRKLVLKKLRAQRASKS